MKTSNLLFTLLLFVFAAQVASAQARKAEGDLATKSCEKLTLQFWESVNAAPWQNVSELQRAVGNAIPILSKDIECFDAKGNCFEISDELGKILMSSRWNSRAELLLLTQHSFGELGRNNPSCADSYLLLQKTDLSKLTAK